MNCAPGAVAIAGGRVLAAGDPDEVLRRAGAHAVRVDLPDRLLMPGLVNAHVHLELTAVGPHRYTGDFVAWLGMVRTHLPDPLDPLSEANAAYFADAARRGARLSRDAGVTTVGDISRFEQVTQAVAAERMAGVSYRELFGLGRPFDESALRHVEGVRRGTHRVGAMRVGLQPHAPYSAGPRLYDAAARSRLPVATHLAESDEELRFVAAAEGRFRDMLEQIGRWDDAFAAVYAAAQTPVGWMRPYLLGRPWLLAHCNYATDDDISTLAETGASVAYCPRASEYFGHKRHRYRDMLDAGVNVCLGTDSIICHGDLSVLAEMRRLHQRDQADPAGLLAMGTTHGMKALGLDPADATLEAGRTLAAGLIAVRYDPTEPVDALRQVLRSREPAEIDILHAPQGD